MVDSVGAFVDALGEIQDQWKPGFEFSQDVAVEPEGREVMRIRQLVANRGWPFEVRAPDVPPLRHPDRDAITILVVATHR